MKKENFLKCQPFLIVCIFAFLFFVLLNNIQDIKEVRYVNLAGAQIKVELALTPEEQMRGLSSRISLADNTGLLFVFADSGEHFFWMKEMNFPIDIIWFGRHRQIIYIQPNAQPENFPETYGPAEDSKYVLEIPAGFANQHNLQIGDQAEFID